MKKLTPIAASKFIRPTSDVSTNPSFRPPQKPSLSLAHPMQKSEREKKREQNLPASPSLKLTSQLLWPLRPFAHHQSRRAPRALISRVSFLCNILSLSTCLPVAPPPADSWAKYITRASAGGSDFGFYAAYRRFRRARSMIAGARGRRYDVLNAATVKEEVQRS